MSSEYEPPKRADSVSEDAKMQPGEFLPDPRGESDDPDVNDIRGSLKEEVPGDQLKRKEMDGGLHGSGQVAAVRNRNKSDNDAEVSRHESHANEEPASYDGSTGDEETDEFGFRRLFRQQNQCELEDPKESGVVDGQDAHGIVDDRDAHINNVDQRKSGVVHTVDATSGAIIPYVCPPKLNVFGNSAYDLVDVALAQAQRQRRPGNASSVFVDINLNDDDQPDSLGDRPAGAEGGHQTTRGTQEIGSTSEVPPQGSFLMDCVTFVANSIWWLILMLADISVAYMVFFLTLLYEVLLEMWDAGKSIVTQVQKLTQRLWGWIRQLLRRIWNIRLHLMPWNNRRSAEGTE
jgi:hypothetical protein